MILGPPPFLRTDSSFSVAVIEVLVACLKSLQTLYHGSHELFIVQ